MMSPRWIDPSAILLLHSASLAEHGGLGGLRDKGLLESALDRPKNRFAYEPASDICDLAAAYGFGLAKNHAFQDGNKRTAFLSVGLFLAINGYKLVADQADAIRVMLSVASGEMEEGAFATWIREHTIALPTAAEPKK